MKLAAVVDFEQADGDRQIETARTAGTRIEVKHAFLGGVIRHVRVAEENGGEFGGGRIEVERCQIVQHVEVVIGGEIDLGRRQIGAGAFAVGVAVNGGDGRDARQSLQDRGLADIAHVENVIDAGQRCQKFGTNESVRVADDAKFHVLDGLLVQQEYSDLRDETGLR